MTEIHFTQSENRQGRQERQVAIFVDPKGVRAASHISKGAWPKPSFSSCFLGALGALGGFSFQFEYFTVS